MTEQSNAKIIEPLAKFHAQPTTKGRITIPKETRKLYNIEEGDYAELLIRKLDPQTKKPTKRAVLIAKVGVNGRVVIPSELSKKMGIQLKQDIIEALLLNFFKPEDILTDKVIFSKYKNQLLRRGYVLISEADEKIIGFQL